MWPYPNGHHAHPTRKTIQPSAPKTHAQEIAWPRSKVAAKRPKKEFLSSNGFVPASMLPQTLSEAEVLEDKELVRTGTPLPE